jgi:hypothetical protein
MNRPRTPKVLPNSTTYDPCRRLLAATVLQSVDDYMFPTRATPRRYRKTADEFLHSEEGYGLLETFVSPVGAQRILYGE